MVIPKTDPGQASGRDPGVVHRDEFLIAGNFSQIDRRRPVPAGSDHHAVYVIAKKFARRSRAALPRFDRRPTACHRVAGDQGWLAVTRSPLAARVARSA